MPRSCDTSGDRFDPLNDAIYLRRIVNRYLEGAVIVILPAHQLLHGLMSYVHLVIMVAARASKGGLLLLLKDTNYFEVHVAVLIV